MSADFYYSIDTSALLHGWVRSYPPTNPMFEQVWELLARLIEEGRLRASIEVLNDVKKKDDGLAEWCEAHPDLIVEIDDDIQKAVSALLGKYPRLVDTSKGRSGSDPFVIALAQTHNPTPLTVVTEEKGGTANKPKIPYVCQEEDVRYISLLELITEQTE